MIFFSTLTVRGPFHREGFTWKWYGGTGLISEKTEVLYVELNERAEAAAGSYSVTGDAIVLNFLKVSEQAICKFA